MTFKQKIERDYPEKINPERLGGVEACPYNYGYESFDARPCVGKGCGELRCESCWNREIPGTEPLTYEHKGEPIGKVSEVITNDNGVKATVVPIAEKEKNVTTKKTKTQMVEEINAAKEQIETLNKAITNMEKHKQYEDAASEVYSLYTAYVNAGFHEDQAFELTKIMLRVKLKN